MFSESFSVLATSIRDELALCFSHVAFRAQESAKRQFAINRSNGAKLRQVARAPHALPRAVLVAAIKVGKMQCEFLFADATELAAVTAHAMAFACQVFAQLLTALVVFGVIGQNRSRC